MKASAVRSNSQFGFHTESVSNREHRQRSYQRVFDERKRPIRGLWVRNGRYYAQLAILNEDTGERKVRRVPLEGATTPAQARSKMEELRVDRRKGQLPVLRRTPKFADYAEQYLDYYRKVEDVKRTSTLETEGYAIDRWKEHLGEMRLDRINPAMINGFIAKRKAAGVSARTVNLEITVFRNVMKRALFDDKWITRLPTDNLRPLKSKPRKRPLVTPSEMEKICWAAFQPAFSEGKVVESGKGKALANAQEFTDFIKLMSMSGGRASETLRLKKTDVDWLNRQLIFGSDGLTKNGKMRRVDFNPKLKAHLKDMFSRLAPDSEWLFPSPRRGDADRPAKTFRESLLLAREAAAMPRFGFHDCRHHFISMCVMAGIDYMTIAEWVGHQDGGILIGKVYGHLAADHKRRQARKVRFDVAG